VELNVQKYLRSGKKPEDLKTTLGIDFKQHPKYPELISFKYDQIESPMGDPIVQECRGLILNKEDNWNVVAFPFAKFFNSAEGHAAEIDWSTASIQSKEDGSLLYIWHYKGEWEVSTTGSPAAEGDVGDWGMTFKDLFWMLFNETNVCYDVEAKGYTWMFELCTLYNRVVVEHKTPKLVFLGGRNNATLQEVAPSIDGLLKIRSTTDRYTLCKVDMLLPKTYPLNSLEACLEAAKHLNPLQNEGYVVCDHLFRRIKIKSPAYVALHHAKDTLSKKHMALIIRTGEYSEFKLALDSFPELRTIFDDLFEVYNQVIFEAFMAYENIKNIESQKEFAEKACLYRYSDILFSMRKRNESVAKILSKMSDNRYLQLMNVR
jgi:hypothetical protein